ncbi:MAG TPA: hypothetical protein VGD89_09650 [Flavipsychrobacter sp.]
MVNVTNISQREKEVLIKHHQEIIYKLNSEIKKLQAELELSKSRIEELSGESVLNKRFYRGGWISKDITVTSDELLNYSSIWTLAKKVEYILTVVKKISTTRQLAEMVSYFEGGAYSEQELKDLVSNLGATLKQKVDKKEVFDRIEQYGDIYYGLRDWFLTDDEEGIAVRPEFRRVRIR